MGRAICQWIGATTLVAVAAGILTGCMPLVKEREKVVRAPFNEEEYARLRIEGMATVSGQAFMKTRGGDVKTAAGNPVFLNPVTTLSAQWYTEYCLAGRDLIGEPDSRYSKTVRATTADGDGKFTFEGVAPGDYYVTSFVRWEVPGQYGLRTQGGQLSRKVSISATKTTGVLLTDNDICPGRIF